MKTNNLLIVLLLFGALLIVGCGTKDTPVPVVPESAQPDQLAGLKDCEFQPADSRMTYAAECGTLTVPENWEATNSRLIALPVVRISARGQNVAEPVFFLQGGAWRNKPILGTSRLAA